MDKVRALHEGDRYLIETHGCQMNEHDSEKISFLLESMGFLPAPSEEEADLIVINTCSVRHSAEDKVYGHVGRLKHVKKTKPDLKLALCGCMMQRKASRDYVLDKFPQVDIIFGTNNIYRLPQLILSSDENDSLAMDIEDNYSDLDNQLQANRSHPFKSYVNIMYGCNNFCTYCIVPYTRGREVSRSMEDIVSEVKDLALEGTKEITLLGQNVNSYGKDLDDKSSFPELLRQINAISGLERIYFMTSHPKDISDELIACYKDLDKLAPYLHLPVQSGSNRILKKMNRHYSREDYFEIIEKIRQLDLKIALSTDIIVGFPGETEEDFKETLDLIEKVGYDNVFTFLYSIREGTQAAGMEDQVPQEVKKDRFQRLLDLVYREQRKKYESLVGSHLEVLVEGVSKNNPEKLTGRTRDFKLIHFEGPKDLIGQSIRVVVKDTSTFALEGEYIEASRS
ncbi:MAG: tRNA (N6-isopentenyl adenosine(37)-C2)-methylthiotransferase MiaB [Tissierellia bacterium]|nr:tRNA (N6-isopentenyl adenosine(37)-C2)-methylthiotransferase MiaB [Tissierellia bacterium]